MKYVYKTIPTHPQFEICDEETLDRCIRTVDTKEYLKVYLCHGYPQCYLCKKYGGDGKKHFLHRLICQTYIGDIPEGYEIDHLNRNVEDFRHTNLRICSHKENMNNPLTLIHKSEIRKKYFDEHPEKAQEHSKRMKKYFSNIENRIKDSETLKKFWREHPEIVKQKAEKTTIPVLQIDKDTGNIINEYPSLKEAGLRTGIRHICECCKGKYKQAGGFIWKYKD